MALFILFGLPGAGKTFVGDIFKKYVNFYFYDGDNELPKEIKQAIKNQAKITDTMRDVFFQKLIKKVQKLKSQHENIVIAQTFIKEKYRKMLLKKIKEASFILIQTDTPIRESRLRNRKDYPLDMEYARNMVLNFEKPSLHHQLILNNKNGENQIKKQIALILTKYPYR